MGLEKPGRPSPEYQGRWKRGFAIVLHTPLAVLLGISNVTKIRKIVFIM